MAIEFDDVTFDPASRRLRVGGAEVHLSPKAFDLLALLIERRPAAVSRGDIHVRLWPSTHVSESSLPSLISEIRNALADHRRVPRLIRTVHRFGYALQREQSVLPPAISTGAPQGWLIGSIAELALTPGDNVVGREGVGVIVLSSTAVSRRHARIRVEGSGVVVVEDLGSKNGTFVNDRRVEGPTPVRDGDQVRLGTVLFTFRSATAVESTQTASTGDRRKAPGA